MRKLRSSIFSSNTLDLKDARLGEYFRVLLVTLLLIAGAELGVRVLLRHAGNTWQYWDEAAAVKFEYYQKLAAAEDYPDVLIVGDSTAARDFAPESMQQVLPQSTIYNLAYPANFPLAFRCTTIPLLQLSQKAPKVVIIQFSPSSFLDSKNTVHFEQSILTSPLCKKWAGQPLAAEHIYLARFWPIFKFQSQWNHWWAGQRPPEQPLYGGFMPLEPVQTDLSVQTFKGQPVTLSDERFAVVLDTIKIVQQRGSKVVVVIPPFYGNYSKDIVDSYLGMLKAAATEEPFLVIDGREVPDLTKDKFYDYVHLDKNGAEIFSAYIAQQIAAYLPETNLP